MPGYILTKQAVQRTALMTRRVLGALPRAPRRARRVYDGEHLSGFLVTGVTAATGGGTTATTATMTVWRGTGTDWHAAETVTLTNRRACFSAAAGAYCIATEINGEFRPLVVCAPPTSSSGSSGSSISSESSI